MFDINPLDVLDKRRVKYACPHFMTASLSYSNIYNNDIPDWIQTKLKGRFFFEKTPGVDKEGKFKSSLTVGFEDPKELTYFMLACPFLRRN